MHTKRKINGSVAVRVEQIPRLFGPLRTAAKMMIQVIVQAVNKVPENLFLNPPVKL
jgi:hypothetical protein